MTAQPEPKPKWNPAEGFPLDFDAASTEELVGALIAVYEHQQQFALRSNGNVAATNRKAAIACPAVHLGVIIDRGHPHEDKIAHRNWGRQHADLLDEILPRIPDELPKFVPRNRRWVSERAYRAVRRHLRDTRAEYRLARNTNPDADAEEGGDTDA